MISGFISLTQDALCASLRGGGGRVKERTSILQSKTKQPVQFEITEGTRKSLRAWIDDPAMVGSDFLWPGDFTILITFQQGNMPDW